MSMAAVVTNPIEIVRTRWQTSGGDVNRPTSILALVREMWTQAGWRAFMRGALIRGIYYVRDDAILHARLTFSIDTLQCPSSAVLFRY